MNNNEIEKKVVEQFQQDENMMIMVFAQWCVNHDLDPVELYERAYPSQSMHPEHRKTIDDVTVPKEEAEDIDTATVLSVLQLFGNTDLAAIVEEQSRKNKPSSD
ncbi:hypothetical protein JCM19038_4260 [Geomicrobium sp. JCM 19038]|nr:hypothetical protein JCM19038_4260 [Geomicrobium sp. JCM 19038]